MRKFIFKNKNAKDKLLRSSLMVQYVKDNLGYAYFNGEYEQICNNDELNLSYTMLYDEIINNPTIFYFNVLNELSDYDYLVCTNKNLKYFNGSNLFGIIDFNSDTKKVYMATEKFSEAKVDNTKLNAIIKKINEEQLSINFDLEISYYKDENEL